MGVLTTQRLHDDFRNQVALAADKLEARVRVRVFSDAVYVGTSFSSFGGGSNAEIRLVDTVNDRVLVPRRGVPDLGDPRRGKSVAVDGYRVENRVANIDVGPDYLIGNLWLQYARPEADVEATIQTVKLFLLLGVLSGTGLALLAGLMIARRAMAPIAELTATAREIERTRDPAMRVPEPEADDEVAELARTLDEMLQALDASRTETEGMLQRQRQFVADASHELRTPLTSVLANLEILADTLDGDRGEAARSALRSSLRMRSLVADLLLLARADAARQAPHEPTDVGQVVVEAAAELGAVAARHELEVHPERAVVDGARDELHRLALNLMENAVRHTPDGTRIRASVHRADGRVTLTVEDDGPGIPAELREHVFERFVRGAGDRGGSFGLGLSIVSAVAESHGGRVVLESPTLNGDGPAHGTRFTVTLPAAA